MDTLPPSTHHAAGTGSDSCLSVCELCRPQVLKKIVWYLLLSPPYSTPFGSASDRATLVAATAGDKRLDELPLYKSLLTAFTTSEIIRWTTFQELYSAEVAAQTDVFAGG